MSSRPNRFIMNTDYLTFAQAGNYTVSVTMPAGTSGAGKMGYVKKEIALPAAKGAIPRFLVTFRTTVYNTETQREETKDVTVPTPGSVTYWPSLGYPKHIIMIARKNDTTLVIGDTVQTAQASQAFPSITFTLNVSYVYPPNA